MVQALDGEAEFFGQAEGEAAFGKRVEVGLQVDAFGVAVGGARGTAVEGDFAASLLEAAGEGGVVGAG